MFGTTFRNREDAGQQLASELTDFKDQPDTLILALVRGGVVVGKAIADALHLPLFPYIVRKIGHPSHREFAVGAIAEGGATYFDPTIHVNADALQSVIDEEQTELSRRTSAYMVTPRPDLKGKTIILTDDGAATGATLFAAMDDLRNAGVAKIILALPVCPPDTAKQLKERADETIILSTPRFFNAVGQWYQEFGQVEDEEVLAILKKSP